MNKLSLGIFFFLVLSLNSCVSQGTNITVTDDPRVEIMGVLSILAGYPEYHQENPGLYFKKTMEHFEKWSDHPAVEKMRGLRETRGMAYNAPMCLAVHLNPQDLSFGFLLSFGIPHRMDNRWTVESIREFIPLLQDFSQKSAFFSFFESSAALRIEGVKRVREAITTAHISPWLNQFFGEVSTVSFFIRPSELVGNNNYGSSVKRAGKLELTPVVGTHGSLYVIVHEFAHGYANPILEKHYPQFHKEAEALFTPVAERMTTMAYGNPLTYLQETLVRASVIHYFLDQQNFSEAGQMMDHEISIGFSMVPRLVEFLKDYKDARDLYPTLADFGPELVEFFKAEEARL